MAFREFGDQVEGVRHFAAIFEDISSARSHDFVRELSFTPTQVQRSYDVVKQVWSQVGTEESDGKLVLRFVNPPYVNVSTGKTEGLVDLTFLVDESCKDCYNSSVLKDLFQQSFGMFFQKDEATDVSSTKGKFLLKKYGIELVPTVILSKDAGIYPSLAQAWSQVGTQEKDGVYVFRNVGLLEGFFKETGATFAYENLTSGAMLPGNASNSSAEAEIEPPAEEK